MSFCTKCGKELPKEAKFCISCGEKVFEAPAATRISKDNAIKSALVPRKKGARTNKIIIISVSLFLFLCLLAGAAIAFYTLKGSSLFVKENLKSDFTQSSDEIPLQYELSEDQKKLISSLGYPDDFFISFNQEKSTRWESWSYFEVAKVISFNDGKFVGEDNLLNEANSLGTTTKYKPEQFHSQLTQEIIKQAWGKPTLESTFETIFGKANGALYPGLILSFDEKGYLIEVQTFPLDGEG
jgi:hypothetical protein